MPFIGVQTFGTVGELMMFLDNIANGDIEKEED
uniref:Uncharacterized protein n=1 Tax=viral metagenome TaxID=1070528 RepID=A0A6C0J0J2_9ZZZZ